MKISLKHNYIIEVDTYNPYTLYVEHKPNNCRFAYTLETLQTLLRRQKKAHMDCAIEELQNLIITNMEIIENISDKLKDILSEKKPFEINTNTKYKIKYNSHNQLFILSRVAINNNDQIQYVKLPNGDITPQITNLAYCKWLRGLIDEYTIYQLIESHHEETIDIKTFCEYYIDILTNFMDNMDIIFLEDDINDESDEDTIDDK